MINIILRVNEFAKSVALWEGTKDWQILELGNKVPERMSLCLKLFSPFPGI